MPGSVVGICNLALDMLGAEPIMSLDDPSKAAALCARNYPAARDAALRAYPWNCATERALLAAEAVAPAWGFAASFPLPVDCLRVLEVDGEMHPGIRWRVEGRKLLADTAGPLRVRYVRRVTDAGLFDELLSQAIAARLAAIIAFAVTGLGNMQERMLAVAAQIEAQARAIDAREQTQDVETVADDWTGARFRAYGVT